MSDLLQHAPYGARDDGAFLDEMNQLTARHLEGNPVLRRIWRDWQPASRVDELPFLHVGIFKNLSFQPETNASGQQYGRILESSATTGSKASRIPLDAESSALQTRSVTAILGDFIGGDSDRSLLIVDSARSLRSAGSISARIAAAMSLRDLASDLSFLLETPDCDSISWKTLRRVLETDKQILVYGFTWALWHAWRAVLANHEFRTALANRRITFLHSGGWKKMEAARVDPGAFDATLAGSGAAGSRVIDFYGLVEQVGIVYPLCPFGSRHVPVWADVLVRDPWSMQVCEGECGQLELMNSLALGAPYHAVLTEDLGRLLPGECPCGRSGRRFELLGRVPKAETRGCSSV